MSKASLLLILVNKVLAQASTVLQERSGGVTEAPMGTQAFLDLTESMPTPELFRGSRQEGTQRSQVTTVQKTTWRFLKWKMNKSKRLY